MLQFCTDFADQAVLLPAALITGLFFWQAGWGRGARAWALCVLALLAVMGPLKLALAGCGTAVSPPPALRLASPSGHTAAAALIIGGGAGLLLRMRLPQTLGLALLAALLTGATRLGLHVHSPAEVALGAVLGIAAAGALQLLAGPAPEALRARRLVPGLVLAVLLLHGTHLHAEAWLHALAASLWPHPGC